MPSVNKTIVVGNSLEIWVTTMSTSHFSVFPFLDTPRELEEYLIVFCKFLSFSPG